MNFILPVERLRETQTLIAFTLIKEFGIDKLGYRLILNGGDYQKVPHLHFHLVSDFKIGEPMEQTATMD